MPLSFRAATFKENKLNTKATSIVNIQKKGSVRFSKTPIILNFCEGKETRTLLDVVKVPEICRVFCCPKQLPFR